MAGWERLTVRCSGACFSEDPQVSFYDTPSCLLSRVVLGHWTGSIQALLCDKLHKLEDALVDQMLQKAVDLLYEEEKK